MSTDTIYPYDIMLYSRNFLNCVQRHSIVMLKDLGAPVDWLFYSCNVPTDRMLDQVIQKRIPKFDFGFDGLSDDDFRMIGVERIVQPCDTFGEAKQELLDMIARNGFAIIAGDVFYFPHCPEYRKIHLYHWVILRSYDEETNSWSIVDDNPASVLCAYVWPESYVRDFYDNGPYRQFLRLNYTPVDEGEVARTAISRYSGLQKSRDPDSLTLLKDIQELLNSPWFSTIRLIEMLSDVFSIYAGSRRCFARFVEIADHPPETAKMVLQVARTATRVRDSLILSKTTLDISAEKISTLSEDITRQELLLQDHLRASAEFPVALERT